jgi:hypothetical protein
MNSILYICKIHFFVKLCLNKIQPVVIVQTYIPISSGDGGKRIMNSKLPSGNLKRPYHKNKRKNGLETALT